MQRMKRSETTGDVLSRMMSGIEGRSVVDNLSIAVTWSMRLIGVTLCLAWCTSHDAAAQNDAPAGESPAAETATEEKSAPQAEPATEAEATTAAPVNKPPQKTVDIVYAEPRATEASDREWRSKHQIKFQNAMKSLAPTNAETKELVDGANMFVDRMTIPKFIHDLHRNVIDPARRSVEGQLTQARPKEILLKAMTDRSVELLTQTPPHHPDIQLGLVILIAALNSQPAGNNTAAIPYTGTSKALIGILENTAYPLQCRITAASGLGRIGREAVVGSKLGDLSVVQRNEVAASLAKMLLDTGSQGAEDGKVWFRTRLAESLGDCGVAYDLSKSSIFIDTLMTVGANPQENIRVRSAAIRSVSQLQLDAQVNLVFVMHETVKLSLEIATKCNEAVDRKRQIRADLRHANLDVYFTFQPRTTLQAGLNWGFLNQIKRNGLSQHDASVTSAYAAVLPVVNHILSNSKKATAVPPAQTAALQAWLDANPPADRKPTSVSPKPVP